MAKQDTSLEFRLINRVTEGLKQISSGLLDIGKSALKVTGIAAGLSAAFGAFKGGQLLTGSISAAGDLEQALARISAATDASGDKLDEYRDRIILAAQATKRSTLEAAQTVEVLARAGLDAEDAISALPATLNLATAANLGAAEAAELLADTLDQFSLPGAQAARVADVIASGALRAGTGVDQMAAALRKAAPAAKEANLSLEDTVAAIGLLAKQGIEGGRAGKGLEAVLQGLADPASKFRDELKKLGISSNDFGTVLQALQGKGDQAKGALEALSSNGKFALQALLTEGGAALRGLTKELEASEGASAKAAERINSTFNTALKNLGDRFEDLKVAFLGPILEPLTTQLDALGKKLIEFTKSTAFKDLQDRFVSVVSAGAKAFGDFIENVNFDEISASIQRFASGTKALVEDIITVVRGLAAAVEVAKRAIDSISEALSDVGQFSGLAARAYGRLTEETNKLGPALEGAGTQAKIAHTEVGNLADTSDLASRFMRALTAVTGAYQKATDAAAGATGPLIEGVEGTQRRFQGATTESGKLVEKLNELNAKIAESIKVGLEQGQTWEQIQGKIAGISAEATKTGEALAKMGEQGNISGEKASEGGDTAARAQQRLAAEAKNAASEVENVGEAAQETGQQTENQATQISGALASFIGLFNQLNAEFSQESEAARKLFIQWEEGTVRVATNIMDALKRLVRSGDATRAAVEGQVDSLNQIVGLFNSVGQGGEDAFASVANRVQLTSEELRQLAANTRNSTQSFELLNRSRLDELASAIDGAASRVQALEDRAKSARDQIRSMGDSLQDELDRIAGNDEKILIRDIERQKQRLRELSKTAGEEGRADIARTMALLDQKLKAELAAIQKRREAERQDRIERDRERREEERQSQSDSDSRSSGSGRAQSTGGGLGAPQSVVHNHYHINGVVGDDEAVVRHIEKVKKRIQGLQR